MRKITRLGLFVAGLLTAGFAASQGFAEEKTVVLTARSGERIQIGHIDLRPAGDGQDFTITIASARFVDLYMEDRSFQCLPEETYHFCLIPFLVSGHIAEGRFAELEHALLFIRKSKNDVALNPFNGQYYEMSSSRKGFVGKARDVDFVDVVAASNKPQGPVVKKEDLHIGPVEDYLFPTVTIE